MGFWSRTFTWWNGATWGTALWTRRFGNEVGKDEAGNVYYHDKKRPWRRWVIYDGANDGSRVPPAWQLWLRGTIDDLPDRALPPIRKFQTTPTPNLTGTMAAFRQTERLEAAGSVQLRLAITSRGFPNKRAKDRRIARARARARFVRERHAAAKCVPCPNRREARPPRRARAASLQWHSALRSSGSSTSATESCRTSPFAPGNRHDGRTLSSASGLRKHSAMGGGKADRRVRPGRSAAPRQELEPNFLGLALQGIALAQRRRKSGL